MLKLKDIVKIYNNMVEKYNEQVENNEKINMFDSKFNEYLDYNKDGDYLGKDLLVNRGKAND